MPKIINGSFDFFLAGAVAAATGVGAVVTVGAEGAEGYAGGVAAGGGGGGVTYGCGTWPSATVCSCPSAEVGLAEEGL